MKKKILVSKITRRTRLKKGKSSIDKRRIYTPMKTTTLQMTMIVK
jgi:hypothetical protein